MCDDSLDMWDALEGFTMGARTRTSTHFVRVRVEWITVKSVE